MSLFRLNTRPSARDLRVFSTLWLLFCGGLGAWTWRQGAPRAAGAIWIVGGIGGLAGLIVPRAMRWVYLAAIYVTFPIGFVMSYVVLGAVYYLVLTPIGLTMRLLRHDPLARRFESHVKSYWQQRNEKKSAQSYFRQH